MEGKEIQNGDSAKSGESKSSKDLEKALQTFIDEADQQKPQTNGRYEKIKNYFSQPKNVLEVAGVVILLTYTIVTIGLWCAQQVSNSINHQSLIDENRPWVKVTLVPNELFWVPGGLNGSMTPNFMVTNVGHSPALRVKGIDLVYLNGSSETLVLAQKNACAFLTDNNARGVVLFPNDSVDLSRPDGEGAIGVSIGQIEVKNGKIISPNHGKTVSFML